MNLDIYTSEMAKSIWDKAFFMDKIIGAKCVIDFGCADGAMIRMLAHLFPDIEFFGYDSNKELIKRAYELTIPFYDFPNVTYWTADELDNMIYYIDVKKGYEPDKICINFSSVLHEVFSNTGGKEKIKYMIDILHPKYITIRDMYFHTRFPDQANLTELERIHVISTFSAIAPGLYNKFVNKFGPVRSWKDLIHFLMKIQWRDNGYEQELEENYFSWYIDDFIRFLDVKYLPIFESHYALPYYLEQWKQYGFFPELHTHAQFILRRND